MRDGGQVERMRHRLSGLRERHPGSSDWRGRVVNTDKWTRLKGGKRDTYYNQGQQSRGVSQSQIHPKVNGRIGNANQPTVSKQQPIRNGARWDLPGA